MKLFVIIVNYNVKYFLEQCLCSVKVAIEAEIIVIDNHSSGGSVEYLQSKFLWGKFIGNKENVGFRKANSIKGENISIASGKYVRMFYEAMRSVVKKHYRRQRKWPLKALNGMDKTRDAWLAAATKAGRAKYIFFLHP